VIGGGLGEDLQGPERDGARVKNERHSHVENNQIYSCIKLFNVVVIETLIIHNLDSINYFDDVTDRTKTFCGVRFFLETARSVTY
jgi:hypothetical protein